jgi:tripartite ATP-independent transporter DctP family solute receptor
MMKKFRCLALLMVLILVFVSCTTFAAVKPVKLVYGTVFPVDHYFVKADRYFKELVEKNSKGQILIDYFPASQLGSCLEMLQATKSGAQQIYGVGFSVQFTPEMVVFELPYLFRDEEHQKKVAQKLTSVIDEDKYIARANMRIIGVRPCSARHLTTKSPVYKLEDLKGLKLRVPENPMYLATWKALGAIPTVIPASDTYTALATGTVNGQENPFSDIYSWKFFEQVKYCALTGHVRAIYVMQINNDCWKKLTKKQQKIVRDAAKKSCDYCDILRKKSEGEYKELLTKGGMKFNTIDTAPFRAKAKTIWSQFADEELLKKIDAIK